jgi:hypothetical protein
VLQAFRRCGENLTACAHELQRLVRRTHARSDAALAALHQVPQTLRAELGQGVADADGASKTLDFLRAVQALHIMPTIGT